MKQFHDGTAYDSEDEKKYAAKGKKSLSQMNFLIAEDNVINAEIITELLELEGARCDLAENGKIAAEMFEQALQGK